ncbi:putative metal-dependent phosphoesterase TrpH [Duganella sp. 1224]|uniref:CehA/McbA family metallohydrolase n=1 Tax=Duganella sp. 1224 TaxID=2587052 RepID=UPI0017B31FFA|nr:CehA/McbA family metallohydrolase [Duganella sp. 1224]NYE63071.1 putative metal-dependent phosphoesterase TrpH [Duganella sp. 1224]
MRPFACLLRVLAWMLCCGAAATAATAPDLVLRGVLTGADHQTYRSVPFDVPAGVERVTIAFDYNGKEQRSVIDLGLLGPDGALRGWSGGSKRLFTVSGVDATPSFVPGPVTPGRWALLLGVPNLRKSAEASYTAQVYFSRGLAAADEPEPLRTVVRSGAAWYRGDLHMHTGHSDGSCANQDGGSVPCPLFPTVQAAADRKLDFIAITEHNTVSHASELRALQPWFSKLLLMPGREITTFSGHANLFGTLAPLDFRIAAGPEGWNKLLDAAVRLHGLVSINHPGLPSGETCMGCGWSNDADLRKVQAIEAVNGTDADGLLSGIPFWQAQLQRGLRPTAIGGSDNHHAGQGKNAVGTPTTVVHAAELSQQAILDGIRAGHVFVDVEGSGKRLLELTASAGEATAMMGDTLQAAQGEAVRFSIHVAHANGASVRLVMDGADASELLPGSDIGSDDARHTFNWHSDGKPHWLRAEVRNARGHLLLLGNPVYLNR